MRKSAKHTTAYPPEFRAEAIRLARTTGTPRSEIARDLGMTAETLRVWVKQAEPYSGQRHDGLTSEEHEELRQLRHSALGYLFPEAYEQTYANSTPVVA